MYMHTERDFMYGLYINNSILYLLQIYYTLCICKPNYIVCYF